MSDIDGLVRIFERQLKDQNEATGLNGAHYLITNDGRPRVERTYQGVTEIIMGFNGEQFTGVLHARWWALCDGRHEYAQGVPFSKRKRLG